MKVAFQLKLSDLAERFKHVDSIYFGRKDIPAGCEGIRLSITRTDGSERFNVVYPRPEAEPEIVRIKKQVEDLLTEHKELGLAAVAQAVWNRLNESAKETGQEGNELTRR